MRSICTVDGCQSRVHSRGLCDSHRYRKLKYGTPLHEYVKAPLAMCTVPGCTNRNSSGGNCATHLYRLRRYGSPLMKKLGSRKPCAAAGCSKPSENKGYCGAHFQRLQRWGDPLGSREDNVCSVDGCTKKRHADCLCDNHLYRMRKYGDPLGNRTVERMPGPAVGRYRVIQCPDPNHPNVMSNGRILEHVWLMTQKLGRALLPKENIHHKNGQRGDNRDDNLELWSTKQPPGQRICDKIAFAKEILRLYEPSALAEEPIAAE